MKNKAEKILWPDKNRYRWQWASQSWLGYSAIFSDIQGLIFRVWYSGSNLILTLNACQVWWILTEWRHAKKTESAILGGDLSCHNSRQRPWRHLYWWLWPQTVSETVSRKPGNLRSAALSFLPDEQSCAFGARNSTGKFEPLHAKRRNRIYRVLQFAA